MDVMKRITILFLVSLFTGISSFAQDEEPKLELKPTGRVWLDAGVMHSNDKTVDGLLNDGVSVSEARIGITAKYDKWRMKAEMGYARQKLVVKDVYLDYAFNKKNFIRGGYFPHQYGLQSAASPSFKMSIEEPAVNLVFNNLRLLGVMYVHSGNHLYTATSVFAENDAMKETTDKLGNEGWGALTRVLYRPFTSRGKILHFGINAGFETPRYNSNAALNHKAFTLKAAYPTNIANVAAQQATIDGAKRLFKYSPEVLGAFGNFSFGAQYHYMNIKREAGLPNFSAKGFYGNVRYLLKGQGYTYSKDAADIAIPDPGAMDIIATYSYSTLNDSHAGIQGGKVSDWSLTYSYYLNKYVIWRIRGSITRVTGNAAYNDNTTSILETRLQFRF